jgi:hypothetical protein
LKTNAGKTKASTKTTKSYLIDIVLQRVTATSNRFGEAAAVGDKIYFAPMDEAKVGVFDVSSNKFSLIMTDGVTATSSRFYGATTVGTKVFFAPFNEAKIGVLDTSTGTFSVIDTGGGGKGKDTNGMTATSKRFYGATTVGTKVYFTPHNELKVGVLDTSTGTFSLIKTNGVTATTFVFFGATTVGTRFTLHPGMKPTLACST